MTIDQHVDDRLARLGELVSGTTSPAHEQNFFEQHFDLPGNPFPPPGIADASGEYPPLRDRDFDALINFIQRGYSTGQRQFLVIKGEYGSGKTQMLRYVEHIVNHIMGKGDHAARAIYVERPRLNAQELNRTILSTLGQDTVKKYVWFAVRGLLLADLQEKPQRFMDIQKNLITQRGQRSKSGRQRPPGQIEMWADGDPALTVPFNAVFNPRVVQDYRTFLDALESKGWSREDVRPYLSTLLLQATKLPDLTLLGQTFVALLLAPDDAAFASWETLLGMTNSKAMLPLRAPEFLRFLLRIMALNGIAYVYMLLDEFEEVSQTALLTLRQRQDYIYTIREVLNGIEEGLSVIIAISPPGWDALLREGVPLPDVAADIINLPRVDLADAIKLVQSYLDRGRSGTTYPQGNLYPLNRELIAYVLDHFPRSAQRTPRSVVQFMHRLLDYAAEHDITVLTPEVAQPLLADFGAMKSGGEHPIGGRRASANAGTPAR